MFGKMLTADFGDDYLCGFVFGNTLKINCVLGGGEFCPDLLIVYSYAVWLYEDDRG